MMIGETMMMKMEKTGKNSLESLFNDQINFQGLVTGKELPADNRDWFSYHMQAMMEELGEVLKADKRWKTHRNKTFNPEEKIDELADVFITAINLAIFSGVSAEDMHSKIENKIRENLEKFKRERAHDGKTISRD